MHREWLTEEVVQECHTLRQVLSVPSLSDAGITGQRVATPGMRQRHEGGRREEGGGERVGMRGEGGRRGEGRGLAVLERDVARY